MSINYVLSTGTTLMPAGKCFARVVPIATLDMEAIVERLVATSTVARPDIVGVLEGFFSTVEEVLMLGMNVNTPLAYFRSAVHGTFDGQADGYDPSRHRIVPRISPGRRLRRVYRTQARAERQVRPRRIPIPKEYSDVASGTANQALTPGGLGRLIGRLLKFDPADPAQGVFFRAADGTETRSASIGWDGPRRVVLLVPPLAPGEYTLEVRASFQDKGDVRCGVLPETLTVL